MCVSNRFYAQESYTERANNYILQYSSLAEEEQIKSGVPAAITLGQGILETEAGASVLATEANNHFGIKCRSDWKGETFTHTDDAPDECFRKYNSAAESYRDHSIYLTTSRRYAALFDLKMTDYKSWAKGLKHCGYATSPTYSQRLIKIIEDFNLEDYTYAALHERKHKKGHETELVNETPAATTQLQEPPQVEETITQTYTSGQEIIMNGLKAVYVMKGEGLLQYAVKYKMRYERLLDINDLPDAPAPNNMFLYLEKKNYRGVRPTHIVKPQETLIQISQQEGIQLHRLMMLNHILKTGEEPVEGTVLELQKTADKKPVLVSADIKTKEQTQPVQHVASPEAYVYKTPVVSERHVAKTEIKDTQPLTAYVQNGDKIEKVELDKNQKHSTVTQNNIATISQVNNISQPVSMSKEKVTYIPVDNSQANNTIAPKVTDNKPVKEDNTAVTTTTTQENNTNDPLAVLKQQLDKVVYSDEDKTAKTVNTVAEDRPVTENLYKELAKENNTDDLYTVKKGDTAFSIARKNNISIDELLRWNHIDRNEVMVGKKLRVKK